MAQFDVYRNPIEEAREQYPFLMDIQSNLLDSLRTRAVVPLARSRNISGVQPSRLTPEITVNTQRVYLMTTNLLSIESSELGRAVANASYHRNDIIGSIDHLISGV